MAHKRHLEALFDSEAFEQVFFVFFSFVNACCRTIFPRVPVRVRAQVPQVQVLRVQVLLVQKKRKILRLPTGPGR